jgi:hypothetical protein
MLAPKTRPGWHDYLRKGIMKLLREVTIYDDFLSGLRRRVN